MHIHIRMNRYTKTQPICNVVPFQWKTTLGPRSSWQNFPPLGKSSQSQARWIIRSASGSRHVDQTLSHFLAKLHEPSACIAYTPKAWFPQNPLRPSPSWLRSTQKHFAHKTLSMNDYNTLTLLVYNTFITAHEGLNTGISQWTPHTSLLQTSHLKNVCCNVHGLLINTSSHIHHEFT